MAPVATKTFTALAFGQQLLGDHLLDLARACASAKAAGSGGWTGGKCASPEARRSEPNASDRP